MDEAAIQLLVEKLVAREVHPLLRRVAELEEQVRSLQNGPLGVTSPGKLARRGTTRESVAHVGLACQCAERYFALLSDEALTQIFSFFPLRVPFVLKQCCRQLRADFQSRSKLFWQCISDFVWTQSLKTDIGADAQSLFRWTSGIGTPIAESNSIDEYNCLVGGPVVAYEIELSSYVASGMSASFMTRVEFSHSSSDGSPERLCLSTDLLDTECRYCKRTSKGYKSETGNTGGHTNTYEAEYLLPCASGIANRVRIGINVTKYFCETDCGWDEGLDMLCLVDGRDLFCIHRDGSDSEYDTQSLNKGILDQLAMQLLVPAQETRSIFMLLWKVLCAPLLACAHWDESKCRFGLGLPHRQESSVLLFTLGTMFINLAGAGKGPQKSWERSLKHATQLPRLQSFLDFVQDR